MPVRWLSPFVVLATMALLAPQARAESIAILPVYADARVSSTTIERLLKAITSHLEALGHKVVQPETAAATTSTTEGECNTPVCYATHTEAAHSELGLVLTLFQDKQGMSASFVLFQPPTHEYYEGVALNPDPKSQVREILDRLLASYAQGPGPWLEVTGEPQHAMLLVDGKVVGLLPYRGLVSRGEHIVLVRATNHHDSSATIRVDNFANTVTRQHIALSPMENAKEQHDHGRILATRRWWPLGVFAGALAIGGATATGLEARNLSRKGECTTSSCAEKHAWSPLSTSFLTGGVVLLAIGASIGAGIWWKRARERASLDANRHGAMLYLKREF